jgi:glycosyltransferase involved in cell wall biosynthesis
MAAPQTRISVVIPVYCGAVTITELVSRLEVVLSQEAIEFEVILVNDGSPDNSWEIIEDLCSKYPWVRGINLMRNYGQHNATLCGVRAARFEIIVTLDDDLQHPPEEIPALLSCLADGADVVYGVPKKMPHSWWRNLFSVLIKRILAWVMNTGSVRDIGAFRAFRASLRQAFESYHNPNVILDVLLSWGTSRFASVPVRQDQVSSDHSNYNFMKLFRVALVALTAYSTAPLQFASLVGFLFILVGLGVFVYVVGVYFLAGSIPGFPFLASIIAIFSGAQLFSLGIIGEYLARIFDSSMDRPPYVIGEERSAAHTSVLEPGSSPAGADHWQ